MSEKQILIADIGGTNARFALVAGQPGSFDHLTTYQCADHKTIESAIDAYIGEQGLTQLSSFCFAAAGAIQNQTVDFTNNHWFADMAAFETRYSLSSSRLLNDFEAISYSLPVLGADQLLAIGGDWDLPKQTGFTLGVLGPGSGLGVGGIIERDGRTYPLINEGGHTGFAPETPYQLEILKALFEDFPRVTNEVLLSGPGFENLYRAICKVEGLAAGDLNAKQIGIRGSIESEASESDAVCQKTLALFFEILGQVAGDLALIQMSFDGIFVAGGISQRYPRDMQQSSFRTGFERKGKHSHLLEKTPTWLVTETNPGLIGASSYASHFLN